MPESAPKGRAVLAVPVILVNLAAVWGQAGWAYDNITTGGLTGLIVAALFAGSVESTGIYLAWESHEALMADQAAALLRAGSYAVGLLAGVLNFVHFAPHSLAAGVAFGALSAVSPWLWGIWSRARNRARLAELGLVDARGVKLSTARKVWHPVRSVKVMSWAAWAGVVDPGMAVAGWQAAQAAPALPDPTPEPEPQPEAEAEPAARPPVVHLVKTPPTRRADRNDDEALAALHQWIDTEGRFPRTTKEARSVAQQVCGAGYGRAMRLWEQVRAEHDATGTGGA